MMDESKKFERARKTTKVLSMLFIVSVLVTIYAVIQKSDSDKKTEQLSQELEQCKNQK